MARRIGILFIVIVIILAIIIGTVVYKGNQNLVDQETISDKKCNITTYNMTEEQIQNLSTKDIPYQTEEDEEIASKEQEVENEEFELQGEIAYNGTSEYPNISLGSYVGLTYYNQTDSRWKDHPYTVTGSSTQTIGISGCGPTSAAMIVTAIKGTITPPQMGDLFVQYGYRSPNNGTYWSSFRWVADVFDIGYQETSSLDTAVDLVRNNNYVVCSVGNGLFTTGGHFVVIVGIDGDMLKIYDPYLYNGKFDTSTRRGKVTILGNTVYCSIDNFRNYANYKGFFAYKNNGNIEENNTNAENNEVMNVKYIKTSTGIGVNVRSGPGISYSKVGALPDGSKVTVYEIQGDWSRIGTNRWVSSNYLQNTSNTNNVIQNTVGNTVKIKACNLYSNSNLTGTVYGYKSNTTVTILQNITSNIDKIRVNVTGRVAYINTANYINTSSSIGQIKRFKGYTIMYSNPNLTGIKYQYKENTSVKILENVSTSVDKVQVVVTGRIAYVMNDSYR